LRRYFFVIKAHISPKYRPKPPKSLCPFELLEGMNQYYSAELSQKVTRGMRETRAKGNFPGGAVMFGYRVENKKVVIHKEEAEIVRYIFNQSASGTAGNILIDELNERGILYRGKPFAKSTFSRLITSEKYIGIFRHGNEVFTNIYPAIVSKDVLNTSKKGLMLINTENTLQKSATY
jgi:hypothetical protein